MKTKKNYNKGCVTHRSMPFWCVANPLADPFGGPVMERLDPVEIARLIAEAAEAGLVEMTAFHDDDLVPWDPKNLEDDLDPKSAACQKLREIKAILDAAGVGVNTATCSLHGNPLFRNGGLCNPDPKIRRLAARKVERTLRMGRFLGARHYVYWVARDGFEVPAATNWAKVYDWLADGLNHVTDYIAEKKMKNYIGASVEPKPNEPRGQMFLPTSGHAVGFILGRLDKPDFWGVNPELLQHESMALMNASMTVAFLCSLKKLKFLHFGSQIKAQFDNDFPPLVGPEGLKETAFMFKTLQDIGWKGVVEYDCHMLRAEGTPDDAYESRRQFIRNCTEALDIALDLAARIQKPEPGLSATQIDLASIRQLCAL
ncbi:MAG: TIM barrel protein [Kiritimatiellia bacterium]|jgi:xylose isomerase